MSNEEFRLPDEAKKQRFQIVKQRFKNYLDESKPPRHRKQSGNKQPQWDKQPAWDQPPKWDYYPPTPEPKKQPKHLGIKHIVFLFLAIVLVMYLVKHSA